MDVPWRVTKGVEPCAVKAASTVLNGEDEETGRKALRLVLTQRKMRNVRLRFSIDRGPWQRSHLSLVFCESLQVIIHKGDTALVYEISPIHRESQRRRGLGPHRVAMEASAAIGGPL